MSDPLTESVREELKKLFQKFDSDQKALQTLADNVDKICKPEEMGAALGLIRGFLVDPNRHIGPRNITSEVFLSLSVKFAERFIPNARKGVSDTRARMLMVLNKTPGVENVISLLRSLSGEMYKPSDMFMLECIDTAIRMLIMANGVADKEVKMRELFRLMPLVAFCLEAKVPCPKLLCDIRTLSSLEFQLRIMTGGLL